jgi:hypothetical protein
MQYLVKFMQYLVKFMQYLVKLVHYPEFMQYFVHDFFVRECSVFLVKCSHEWQVLALHEYVRYGTA